MDKRIDVLKVVDAVYLTVSGIYGMADFNRGLVGSLSDLKRFLYWLGMTPSAIHYLIWRIHKDGYYYNWNENFSWRKSNA